MHSRQPCIHASVSASGTCTRYHFGAMVVVLGHRTRPQRATPGGDRDRRSTNARTRYIGDTQTQLHLRCLATNHHSFARRKSHLAEWLQSVGVVHRENPHYDETVGTGKWLRYKRNFEKTTTCFQCTAVKSHEMLKEAISL